MKTFPLLALGALLLLPAAASAAEPVGDTIIDCAGLFETISTDKEIISTFRDQVVVTGNNLKLTCDYLVVIAIRKTGDTTAALGKYGYFKSLVATGNVRIMQGDREATCGRAEIFPGEDKIILSEKVGDALPRVRDNESTAEGPRLTLYRGQRKAMIEGDAATNTGIRIKLPAIKDLGFDKNAPEVAPKPPALK